MKAGNEWATKLLSERTGHRQRQWMMDQTQSLSEVSHCLQCMFGLNSGIAQLSKDYGPITQT
jgi:hypothetical protein